MNMQKGLNSSEAWKFPYKELTYVSFDQSKAKQNSEVLPIV